MSVRPINADCLRAMRLMALYGVQVDSIVTDPPYHLTSIVKRFGASAAAPAQAGATGAYKRHSTGFMGKQWDGGNIAADPETWALAYDVLKPGGHLVAFGGTRTYHRMVCAIEDAGFEIRDQLAWMFGTGFPKSHDVSKGIDKANGKHNRDLQPFADYVKSARETKGLSRRALDDLMGTNTAVSWWEGRASGIQPPGIKTYGKLKKTLELDDRFDELIAWVEAEREKVGEKESACFSDEKRHTIGASSVQTINITAPATDAAREWEGWGTALKPAHEPICLARKPLSEKSVAANVLKHGTGAVNVDGCRVETSESTVRQSGTNGNIYGTDDRANIRGSDKGRWPANVIHDGSDEVVGMFPQTGQMGTGTGSGGIWSPSTGEPAGPQHGDSGSAARFFYSAKAGPDDRYGSKHPTVKPVSLMRWLVRLVTPPGGLVLDPFAGTGSTGIACIRESMRAILIEREAEYFADIKARLAALDGSDAPLFSGEPEQSDIESLL